MADVIQRITTDPERPGEVVIVCEVDGSEVWRSYDSDEVDPVGRVNPDYPYRDER